MTRALPSTDTSPIITICDQVRPPARKHLVGYTTSNSASGTDRGVLHGKQHSPRHADGAVSQSLDYGGITGTKMGRAAAWPASKKSKTHDAPRPPAQPPAPPQDASFREQIEMRAQVRLSHRQPGAGGRGAGSLAPGGAAGADVGPATGARTPRTSVRMSVHGLAHLAMGTVMTLDQRAAVLGDLRCACRKPGKRAL